MDLFHIINRLGRSVWQRSLAGLLVLAGVLTAAAWLGSTVSAQVQINRLGRWTRGEQHSVAGVYLPTDRALSRAVARARERLSNGEYHGALAFLHEILGRTEDTFLEEFDGEREQSGLKATARRLIGDLPPAGHEAYELLHGAAARRQLEAALQAGDQRDIAKVVRQFFHTSAGYEAALVLAQIEVDQGHRLAAAQLYQELLDAPRAASQFEPQLSVMAATNQFAAGQAEAAAKTLRSLFANRPSSEIMLSGQTMSAPAATADLIEWLTQVVGKPVQRPPSDTDWLTQRGDPARNTRVTGGPPHLRARWQARVVNDPTIEAYLAVRNDDFAERGVVVVPGARPVAAGNVVVMRTPSNVIAVDWRTGKRIWETREDDEFKAGESSGLRQRINGQQLAEQGNSIDDRVWDDTLANSLSSDGERVFVLRDINIPENEQVMAWQVAPGFGGIRNERNATTNQLSAYDLATQGKLLWELDGSRSSGDLDGAFFLGAPLAIDDTLYVMAEIRSAIYLMALDPATGSVRWQQQLVGLEQGISLDPVRRRSGATPSYDGGILVCPTAASVVVAIDVVKREFAWVYRYSRHPQTPAEARNLWQHTGQPQVPRANDRWLDGSAIIAEGRVFLTPPESSDLHCLDLRTGKLIWKQRQGDALFIGGVDDGRLLLVGNDEVQALRVADGMPAWERDSRPLPTNALPAGHGYTSNGHYYLPLTSGEIAAIEIASGDLTAVPAAQSDVALGNLICYRGSVLSQSPLTLDKFEQLEALRQRAEAALADNPDDATALRELAELTGADGNTREAVALLKRAFKLAPNDPLGQEMLAEMLLEALTDDYTAFRGDVPLVTRLIRNPQQQIKLMRIESQELETLGHTLEAWDAYLRLADFTTEEPVQLGIDKAHRVRSDRWIAGRLGSLWLSASAEDREAITARIAERRPSGKTSHTAGEMRHYLAHLDQLPGADTLRQALVRFLSDRSRAAEAEIELLKLSKSPQRDSRSAAVAALKRLQREAAGGSANAAVQQAWPSGKIETRLIPVAASGAESAARLRGERQAGYRLLRIEQQYGPSSNDVQWLVAMDCSEIIARNASGDDIFHLPIEQMNSSRQYRDSGLVHAARLGQMLYVVVSGQILAIDARRSGSGIQGELLWQTDPLGRYAVDNARSHRLPANKAARTSRRPVYHASSSRKRLVGSIGEGICSLGPVSPQGVVFQDQNDLKCVDPLNGEVLWSRSDLPAGCELFGDDEFVFAADINGRVAHVVRMIDGELIGSRDLQQHEWLITAGRNVAELGFRIDPSGRTLSLRVRDIWLQEVLFKGDYSTASRLAVIEPGAIAVCEPSGSFQLIDARTGGVLIDRQLDAVDELHSLQAMRSGDRLFLFISSQALPQYKPLGQFDFPIINGFVYAFDMKTGESLWPAPALVRNRGVFMAQPDDIPLLLFAERKLTRDAATGGVTQLRVLALDKRTGQSVYRNDALPDTPLTRFRVRAERHADPTVALEMNTGKIEWALSDAPRPPQPPGNDDLEAPREVEEGGLRGIGRRIGEALRGHLREGAEKKSPPLGPNPPVDEPEESQVPDDD
jgi:outer membrane protein assembly factor BamB